MLPASAASVKNLAVIETSSIMQMLQGGPEMPPLPPLECYGRMRVPSNLVGSVCPASVAEAAAREVGGYPAKVQFPAYSFGFIEGFFNFERTEPANDLGRAF